MYTVSDTCMTGKVSTAELTCSASWYKYLPSIVGREAFSKLKILDLRLIVKKKAVTSTFCAGSEAARSTCMSRDIT